MTDLPLKLSDCILVALADLEKCEADPRYTINMVTWHEHYKGVCNVCLAGATISQTLGKPFDFDTKVSWEDLAQNPDSAPSYNSIRLTALDSVRSCTIVFAVEYVEGSDGMTQDQRVDRAVKLRAIENDLMVDYACYNPATTMFQDYLRNAAAALKEAGY